MSYFRTLEENRSDVGSIQKDLDCHATSNLVSGSSSGGGMGKPAGETMTAKRTTMKLGSGDLKRSKE